VIAGLYTSFRAVDNYLRHLISGAIPTTPIR
jgi:hypothetical protein